MNKSMREGPQPGQSHLSELERDHRSQITDHCRISGAEAVSAHCDLQSVICDLMMGQKNSLVSHVFLDAIALFDPVFWVLTLALRIQETLLPIHGDTPFTFR
jgi:hypothetical protein